MYPGYGENNSKAGLKIQTIYSIKFNKVVNLDTYPQSSCDRSYSLKSTDYMNEKELLLTDLGYLDSLSLKKLMLKNAYSVFNLPYAKAYEDDLSILRFFKAFGEYARNIGAAIAAKRIIDIVNIFSKVNSRSKREKRKTTVSRLKSYEVPPVVNMKILA